MMLLGYLYGIPSERRLAEEVSLHLGYRWFLGYDFDVPTPDHSVLSKARARFGSEVFEEFFRQFIQLCRNAGLLEEGPVYVDSTLIRAGASLDSLRRREDLLRPPLSVKEYLERLDQEAEAEGRDEPSGPEPPPESGSGDEEDSRPLRPNEEKLSRTDPEATLVNQPQFGCHLAYKAHLAVGGRRGQVVTAAVATTGAAADEHHLAEVLWQHRRLSGLGIPAAVADAKYGTTFNFLYLGRLGIPAFIPLTRFGNMRKDIWGREHFKWLPDEDAQPRAAGLQALPLCPGQRHSARSISRGQGQLRRLPFPRAVHPVGKRKVYGPFLGPRICRPNGTTAGQPSWQAAPGRKGDLYRGSLRPGEELHGLRRTRFKGRYRVQIQLWLTAAAMNIKKAARTMAEKPGQAGTHLILAALRCWAIPFPRLTPRAAEIRSLRQQPRRISVRGRSRAKQPACGCRPAGVDLFTAFSAQ